MPNLSVTTSAYPQHKDITLLSVKGYIDTSTAGEFEKAFQTVLSEKKFNLIVDLKEVNYISSVGWGIFIGEIKRIRSQKGDLFLVALGPETTEAFELLELESILKTFSTVEQAVQTGFSRSSTAGSLEKPKTKKGPAKIPAKKGSEKNPTEKNIEKIQTEAALEKPLMEKTSETAPVDIVPAKSQGWVKILLPWKWF